MVGLDRLQHGLAPSLGEVHVQQHDIGNTLDDQLDGGVHLVGLADHLHLVAQLGPHAGTEQVVVVDEEHSRLGRRAHPRSTP